MALYSNPTIDQQREKPQIIFYLDNKCAIFTCHGNPDGQILANTGSIACSDDGNVYKKTTDNVATGWIDLAGGGGGGGADTDLGNLTPTAINEDLIPDTDNTHSIGTTLLRWTNLFLGGFLQLSGTDVGSFHTPVGNNVPTKIDIPTFDPGNFGQIIAFGLDNTANGTARAMSLFDRRPADHQTTLAIFSPDENQLLGLSWNGSNINGQVTCSQNLLLNGVRTFIHAPNSAPTDADIPNSTIAIRLDEAANQISLRVRYSDGTLKTGTINLV